MNRSFCAQHHGFIAFARHVMIHHFMNATTRFAMKMMDKQNVSLFSICACYTSILAAWHEVETEGRSPTVRYSFTFRAKP